MFPANNLEKYLEKYFEELHNQNWTLIPIDLDFARELQKSAKNKFDSNQFKIAKVSHELHSSETQQKVRKDYIFWLDENLDAKLDIKSNTQLTVDLMVLRQLEVLIINLKNYFRVSLSDLECHYAVYPVGHFYEKHLDITAENNKRVFSFVIYLNDTWSDIDGGHLIGYQSPSQVIFNISPTIGHMILFKSEIEHEVMKTNKIRYSLTGWIRR